jgi:hypothetical protein
VLFQASGLQRFLLHGDPFAVLLAGIFEEGMPRTLFSAPASG